MSETTSTPVGHEAYAFACMNCGYGWEQAYDIEHHTDISGHEFVVYKAGGRRVPSPLSNPTCVNCGRHRVRIMRAGQVSSVLELLAQHQAEPTKGSVGSAGPTLGQERKQETEEAPPAEPAREPHHWHLSDLLHAFHRK
ncbi:MULTISPECIES: hypothetical protein [unclassified Streptomyces]|uniref:hypothetical protein n=1 Tax=unclassified Streptomyces TaxID=2593676 RepID=UPI00093A65D8|nr:MULTISPECIES: hypothetical protein [unclassified Streptomyces]OKJ99690.1 hypothetical protein AMK26_27195 [Streptomyces sp. CB03234]ORT58532.1 hypothetical protein BKD26_18205 [Streptomyces sp. CB03238]